jgi:very-short-patch-repair endonuclease
VKAPIIVRFCAIMVPSLRRTRPAQRLLLRPQGTTIMGTPALLLAIAVAVLLVLLVLLFFKARGQSDSDDEAWPFYARKPLSQAEQILYFRLVRALPEHIVLAQVQLSRLLGVRKGNSHQSWTNRINRMSVDFVVCHKDSTIVAVIELDDATHEQQERRTADARKDKALASAAVRLIRWQARSIPDIATIQSAFLPGASVNAAQPWH